MARPKAFTLVEILIAVVILGILAAIVIPLAARSVGCAKDNALAEDVAMLRRFILVYKAQHLEVAPGYPDGAVTAAPTEEAFLRQTTMSSDAYGRTAAIRTLGFPHGPYMQKIPVNPFNSRTSIRMLGNGEDFPAEADGTCGWIYKAQTSEIRADYPGTDESAKRYYDY